MPAKHVVKPFIAHTYYHLYNRGVEKRTIFQNEKDYAVLLSYLKTYLLPKNEKELQSILTSPITTSKEKTEAIKLLRLNNFYNSIQLCSYCLMPNHFHFLIKQTDATAIDKFMNSLWTRYTMYFNKTYKRIGPLFQSLYKAVPIQTNDQLLYITRYIHRNPISILRYKKLASKGSALRSWIWSSYPEYIKMRKTEWIKPSAILSQFGKIEMNTYQSFVETETENETTQILLSPLHLEQ
jgi:putative transposase